MKAADLKLEELVDFAEGSLSLHGRRLVLHSIHAMAQFRRDLADMVGLEQTRRILTRFGYFWGNADAAAMKRIFTWDSLDEWLRAGPRMHSLEGVTKAEVKALEVDEGERRFMMRLIWRRSGEAEEHQMEFGTAKMPICWMLVGYMSGYASFCLGRDVYFIEDKCRGKGDRICTAVGKDAASWGDELTAHVPYYEADDIQGKVQDLTLALRKQTRVVARQRRRLRLLEKKTVTPFVEVRSDSFRRVLDAASRVAPFDSSVLITGETGVGKEVLARYVHGESERRRQPFVAVNCGALPETLLESELFGHRAGSFTGATRNRVGLFEQANGGTILLDEIGDVSVTLQVKLLRVIQEREIMRVGDSTLRTIDVRILAATNRNLAEAVGVGDFRQDLYYRLGVIEIRIPPLRERPEDILPLARHFVRRFAQKLKLQGLRLDATCLDYLQGYAWPGNVRELENAIERAAVLSQDGHIRPEDLGIHIVHAARPGATTGPRPLAAVEKEHILAVLEHTGGNRTAAARLLGIGVVTLWRKLKSYES